MTKTYRIGVVRTAYRIGFGRVFQRVTVGADDPSQDASDAIDMMLITGDPQRRLNAIKNRAGRHRGIRGLTAEIDAVETRLAGSNWIAEPEDLNALLALERGIDLLDVGAYLNELEGLRRAGAGRVAGLLASATRRTKLPDAATLILEIAATTRHEGGSHRAAVGAIAKKYRVSTQAVGKRIRKGSETT